MSTGSEWDFAKGHRFASLVGTYTFVLSILGWLFSQGKSGDASILAQITALLGVAIAASLLAILCGAVMLPWSFVMFRIICRLKSPGIAAFAFAGICSVALTFCSIGLFAWMSGQMHRQNQEDYSPVGDLEDGSLTSLIFVSLGISGAAGGAAFFRLGRKHPAALPIGNKQ